MDVTWTLSSVPVALELEVYDSLTCAGGSSVVELAPAATGSTTAAAGTMVEGVGDPVALQPGTYGFAINAHYDGGNRRSGCMVGTVDWAPAASAPPSWWQSYGRPSSDATCDKGWNPSWAQWANGGKGGYVCNREQYYDATSGEWSFR